MKNDLPPGTYEGKMVGEPVIKHDPKTGEATLVGTFKIPALGDGDIKVEIARSKLVPGDTLSKDDIERLARVAWENTGKGDFPVLPPGQAWVDQTTGKPVDPKDLVTAWDQVTTKDIFRRQAAAVALALGFKLADDVPVKPRVIARALGHNLTEDAEVSQGAAKVLSDRFEATQKWGLPFDDVSCPACGEIYGKNGKMVCKCCEECSSCCRCKKGKKQLMSADEFVESLKE